MPDAPITGPQAAKPAEHQVAAYSHETLMAKTVQVLGTLVAVISAITPVLGSNARLGMILGTVAAVAGTLQHALAHSAFQQATDAP